MSRRIFPKDLQKRGLWSVDSLTYDLTSKGEAMVALEPRDTQLRQAGISFADLKLLARLRVGAVSRADLESDDENGMKLGSRLAYLQDQGLIAVTGILRGTARLTARGRQVLDRHQGLLALAGGSDRHE